MRIASSENPAVEVGQIPIGGVFQLHNKYYMVLHKEEDTPRGMINCVCLSTCRAVHLGNLEIAKTKPNAVLFPEGVP